MIAVVSLRATTESGLSIRFSLLVYTLLRRFRRANSSQIYAQTTVSTPGANWLHGVAEYCILNSSQLAWPIGLSTTGRSVLVYLSFSALPKWSDDIEKSIEFLAKTPNFD